MEEKDAVAFGLLFWRGCDPRLDDSRIANHLVPRSPNDILGETKFGVDLSHLIFCDDAVGMGGRLQSGVDHWTSDSDHDQCAPNLPSRT